MFSRGKNRDWYKFFCAVKARINTYTYKRDALAFVLNLITFRIASII